MQVSQEDLVNNDLPKNSENSESVKIHIGKGPIYQDLSMEINCKWVLSAPC